MNTKSIGILLGLIFTASITSASASILSYEFSGVVSYQGYAGFNSPVGSSFSGQLSYDTSVLPSSQIAFPDGGIAMYSALVSLSVEFEAASASYNGPTLKPIYVQDFDPGSSFANDIIDFHADSPKITKIPGLFGRSSSLRLYFSDTNNLILGSTSLPQTLSLGTDNRVIFDVDGQQLQGQITSLHQVGAVPEPATWVMMIFGFAGIGVLTYRRRYQARALTT
jgi:hypothetical protein